MGLDAELLSRNKQSSSQRAGNLNRARRSSLNNNSQNSDLGSYYNPHAARHAAQTKKNALVGGTKIQALTLDNSAQLATDNLLKQAWLNLIDSFGLTLVWINIHVFLSQVFGEKLFRKLKLWESMVLGSLDLLVLIGVIMIFGFFYLVVTGQGVILVLKGLFGPLWGIASK